MQPFVAFRRSVSFRVQARAIAGAAAAPVEAGRPVRAVTAVGVPELLDRPLVLIDVATHQGRSQKREITALATALLPPMRPVSLAFALLLAVLSLAWWPLALLAAAYASYRVLHRAMWRRSLAAEIEQHLLRQLGAEWSDIESEPLQRGA